MQKKVIEKEQFVAIDGSMFNKEEDCIKYEARLGEENRYKIAKEYVETNLRQDEKFVPFDLFVKANGNLRECNVYLKRYKYSVKTFKLESEEDADMLAEVKAIENPGYKQTKEKARKKMGKLVFPCTVGYYDGCDFGREPISLEKYEKMVQKYFGLYGIDVKFENRA